MSKRTFLLPFVVALSGLTQPADAAPAPNVAPASPAIPALDLGDVPGPQTAQANIGEVTMNVAGELFGFVLQRSEGGEVVAYHTSHASHESHSSHRSHYSSR